MQSQAYVILRRLAKRGLEGRTISMPGNQDSTNRNRRAAQRLGSNYARRSGEGNPTMKVGLFVNTQFPEGFDVAGRVPEMVAQVRAAAAA